MPTSSPLAARAGAFHQPGGGICQTRERHAGARAWALQIARLAPPGSRRAWSYLISKRRNHPARRSESPASTWARCGWRGQMAARAGQLLAACQPINRSSPPAPAQPFRQPRHRPPAHPAPRLAAHARFQMTCRLIKQQIDPWGLTDVVRPRDVQHCKGCERSPGRSVPTVPNTYHNTTKCIPPSGPLTTLSRNGSSAGHLDEAVPPKPLQHQAGSAAVRPTSGSSRFEQAA